MLTRLINPPKNLALGIPVLIGALLRLWHIGWGLPEVYEEAYPFAIAWKFWNWGQGGLDFNPHFFNYPALTFYLNFLVQAAHYGVGHLFGYYPTLESFHGSYAVDPTVHIILARLLSVLFDAGTIIAIYKLGKECVNETAGMIAAVIVAGNPLFIRQAHTINVDTPLTFFVVLSLYLILSASRDGSSRLWVLSAVAIGLAAASKYTGAMLLVLFALALYLRRKSKSDVRPGESSVLSMRNKLVGGLSTFALTFALWNPFILLDFNEFVRDFGFEETHMSAGHLGVDPTTTTTSFYFGNVLPNYFGWLLVGAVVVGSVTTAAKRRKELLLLMVFPVIYLVVISSWKMRADRYLLPVLPILSLLGSIGILEFCNSLASYAEKKRWSSIPRTKLAAILAASIVGLTILQPAMSIISYERSMALPDTRLLAKEWVQQHLPRGSVIASAPLGLEFSDSSYLILSIPFLPVSPERVAFFYDTRWYEDCDVVIGSDFDYSRYVLDPSRYRNFLEYYATLRGTWTLLHEIRPVEFQPGPSIWLFHYPDSLQRNRFDERVFERLSSAPESSRVSGFLKQLASVVARKGKLQKAEQLAREIVSVENTNPDAHRLLAGVLFELGKDSEALGESELSLAIKPDQAEILGLRGSILLRHKKYSEAEPALLRAVALDKHLEYAYDELLMIYVQRRDKPRAIDILTRHYNILDPESEKARLVAADLKRLKSMP